MTDHLPECWCAGRCPSYPGEDCPCRDCICVELRACEQRVRGDMVETVIGILQYAHNTSAALGGMAWERLIHDLRGLRKVDTPSEN